MPCVEHHQNYLQSEASIPERCMYTIPTPTCQLSTSCPYAHTEEERKELIKKLSSYDRMEPRPIPRHDKLLAYTLCENHKSPKKSFEGECIYGRNCKLAHNKWELVSWEAERKAKELNQLAVRPFNAREYELRLCKDMTRGVERGVARAGGVTDARPCGGEKCRYAHSDEELREWIRKCMLLVVPCEAIPVAITCSSLHPELVSAALSKVFFCSNTGCYNPGGPCT